MGVVWVGFLITSALKNNSPFPNQPTWVQVMHSKNVPVASFWHIEHLGGFVWVPLHTRASEPLVAAAAASRGPYLGLYLHAHIRTRVRGKFSRVVRGMYGSRGCLLGVCSSFVTYSRLCGVGVCVEGWEQTLGLDSNRIVFHRRPSL